MKSNKDMHTMMELIGQKIEAEVDVQLFKMGALPLGEFISKLKKFDSNYNVYVKYEGTPMGVHMLHSYRGFYRMLALEPTEKFETVRELSYTLYDANDAIFTGYKGGEYSMDEDSWLFISPYGEASRMAITDVVEDPDHPINERSSVQIITKEMVD